MAVSWKAVTKNLWKNKATHVTIDNNDGVQETVTGKDTNIKHHNISTSLQ